MITNRNIWIFLKKEKKTWLKSQRKKESGRRFIKGKVRQSEKESGRELPRARKERTTERKKMK